MFWIITAAVVVVLVAIAWWTSGKARPRRPGPERPMSPAEADALAQTQARRVNGNQIGGAGG